MRASYHAVALLFCASATARGANLAGAGGASAADAVLVGTGGEIFRREDGAWHRRGGGVSEPILHVWDGGKGNLWALGARAPAFRHDGQTWLTVIGTRGTPATLSAPGSPAPAVTVGRRVFLGEKGTLRALPLTPGPATAVLIRAPNDALAIVDGKLHRLAGAWKPLVTPEPLRDLCGAGGKSAIALGVAGGVFTITGDRSRRQARDGFEPQMCGAGSGRVLVAGQGGAIFEVTDKGLVALPAVPVPAGDFPAVLLPFAGSGELVATRAGHVYLRAGGDWKEEPVDDAPPATTGHPVSPPAPIPQP